MKCYIVSQTILKMKFRLSIFLPVALMLLSSCGAVENINYFQDVSDKGLNQPVTPSRITIRPKDQISIIVNSKDMTLTQLFNLPYVTQRLGQNTGANTTTYSSSGVCGYTVDKDGYIDFPILGKLKIEGLSREETAAYIKMRLISEELIKDPVVTVDFMNLAVSVLGEVKAPGRYYIDRDDYTLLDAISKAGDLTIYGVRENVLVMRLEDNVQKSYHVDLTSAQDLFSSPVYYLRQNDVIYVEPNDKRARESTVNGNNVRSSSFWISIASLAASVASIIINSLP